MKRVSTIAGVDFDQFKTKTAEDIKPRLPQAEIDALAAETGFLARTVQPNTTNIAATPAMQQLNVKVDQQFYLDFLKIVEKLDTTKKRAMERMITDYLSRLV